MDSITQATLGAAVGGAVIGRQAGWRAFAWGAAIATLPDLDSLVPYADPVARFTYHRGYTHSLIVQTLAAPLLARPLYRLHRDRGGTFRRWWLAIWLVLITHALLDSFTIYGTQLLLPLSDHPFGRGSVFIIDPMYTLPLLCGVIVAVAGRRRWPRARLANAAGLALSTAYLAWTVAAQQWVHMRAETTLRAGDVPAQRVLATPTPFNSLVWRVVAVGGDGYWEGFHRIGGDGPIRFRRHPSDPGLLDAVEDEWPVRRLQRFTKGFYAVNERDGAVVITDLRMGQSGFYVFAFEVATRENGSSRPSPTRRYRYPRPDVGAFLEALVACGRGKRTPLLPC